MKNFQSLLSRFYRLCRSHISLARLDAAILGPHEAQMILAAQELTRRGGALIPWRAVIATSGTRPERIRLSDRT